MTARLDVVVVNWNAGALVAACLDSLVAADRGDGMLRIIVVDNASTDGSAEALAQRTVPGTAIIRNAVNRGFAAACNQGAAAGAAPYVLFLNPDTTVTRDALEHVLGFMDSAAASDVGICGIQLTDDAGLVSRSCSRHPTPFRMLGALVGLDRLAPRLCRPHLMTEWDHAGSRDVEQVIGAFYLVRRAVFQELAGFDERFFVYYEEVDFAARASAAGWRAHYFTGATAYHLGGGTTDGVRAFRQFLVTRSRILYANKHFPGAVAWIHALGTLLVEPVVRAGGFLVRGDGTSAAATLDATARLWRAAPELLARRRRS